MKQLSNEFHSEQTVIRIANPGHQVYQTQSNRTPPEEISNASAQQRSVLNSNQQINMCINDQHPCI